MAWLIGKCIVAVLVGYGLASFFQAWLHRICGHHRRGGALFRTHVGSHHSLYRSERMTLDRYEEDEVILTPYYLIPYVVLSGSAYPFLSRWIFAVYAVSLTASFWAHAYFHVQFHLTRSRWRRFRWFRRLQALHFVHHDHAGANFGLISFWWDRMWGTFREAQPLGVNSEKHAGEAPKEAATPLVAARTDERN